MNIKIVINLKSNNTRFPLRYFYNLGGFPYLFFFISRIKNNNNNIYISFTDKKTHKEIKEILYKQKVKYIFIKNIKKKFNIFKKINFSSNDIVVFLNLENPIIDGFALNDFCKALSLQKKNHIKINRNIELFFGKNIKKKFHNQKEKKLQNSPLLQKMLSNLKFSLNSIEEFIYLNKIIKKIKKPLDLNVNNIIGKFKKIRKIEKKSKSYLKKKLIILGGSHDQIGTIQITNSMNINSIVFDKNLNSPGKKISDLFIFKSAKDVKNISYFAKKIKANGVLLQGPDFPYVSSAIEKTLGIKNVPIKAASICTNKYSMKKLFKKISIPIPKFRLIHNKDKKKNLNLRFPVVIKPLDKSASRGVFFCENYKSLIKLKNKSLLETNKKVLQVEEYLTGPQLSTESFIYKGKVYTPGFVDRNYEMLEKTKPFIIENGGVYPSSFFKYYDEINSYIKIISKALKIKNGVIKSDIVIHNSKIFFIEIAVRLSGGDFSETLIPLSSSFNLLKNSINLATGNKINKNDLKIKFKNKFLANRYFFSKKGKLKKIYGMEKIINKSWIKKFKIFYNVNESLPATTNHATRLGVFVVEAKSRDLLNKRIKMVYDKIKFKII